MSKSSYKVTTTSGPGRATLALSAAAYRVFNILGIKQNSFSRMHLLHLALAEMREVDEGKRAPAKSWVFYPVQDEHGNAGMQEARTITLFEAGKGYTTYAIDPRTGERTAIRGVNAKPREIKPD